MEQQRWTGLQERESELLILNPLILNDGSAVAGGLAVPGYQYRLPIQGHNWRCRSLSVIPREQFTGIEMGGPGQINSKSGGLRDWLLTLVSPTGDVLHKDIPLTHFLRNVGGLGLAGMQALPRYFGPESYFDARQSFATYTDRAGVSNFVVFRFIYA